MESLVKAGLPGLSDRHCAAGLSQVTGFGDTWQMSLMFPAVGISYVQRACGRGPVAVSLGGLGTPRNKPWGQEGSRRGPGWGRQVGTASREGGDGRGQRTEKRGRDPLAADGGPGQPPSQPRAFRRVGNPGPAPGGDRRPSEVRSTARLLTVHTSSRRHELICPGRQPSGTRGNAVTSVTTGIRWALSSSALSLRVLPKTHEEGDTSLQMRDPGLLAQVVDSQGHQEQGSWGDFGALWGADAVASAEGCGPVSAR